MGLGSSGGNDMDLEPNPFAYEAREKVLDSGPINYWTRKLVPNPFFLELETPGNWIIGYPFASLQSLDPCVRTSRITCLLTSYKKLWLDSLGAHYRLSTRLNAADPLFSSLFSLNLSRFHLVSVSKTRVWVF